MDNNTVLVLANPVESQLKMLDALPPETSIAVGNTPDAFERTAADANVILNWSGSGALLRTVFGMAPRVAWVHSKAAGLDDQLFPALVESHVPMTNSQGIFSQPLGEFAIGAVLFFAKDFRRMLRNQAAKRWDVFDCDWVSGSTMGIVGYGDIGRAVATRAKAMGMRVLAVKRHVTAQNSPDPVVSNVYGPDKLHEMLAQCDYVVIATPLTPETRGMFGPAEFAAMKPNAVVINIGRGPVIQEPAMIAALSANRIRGAALDVFEVEPLPESSPLWNLENVLLSSHSADHTHDWLDRAMQFFLEQFERFRKGEPLLNVVNKKLGY